MIRGIRRLHRSGGKHQAESIGDAAEARADLDRQGANSRADSIVAHRRWSVPCAGEVPGQTPRVERAMGQGTPTPIRDTSPSCFWSWITTTVSPTTWCSLPASSAPSVVYRNDAISVEGALALGPEAIAPGHVLRARPYLGRVDSRRCRPSADPGGVLGHQAIGEAFRRKVGSAERLMRGETTLVVHSGHPVRDIASPLEVMRYHSLVVSSEGLPRMEITAWSQDRPAGSKMMGFATVPFRLKAYNPS